jgi:hypothetical protein
MLRISEETNKLLDDVEQLAQRKLHYRAEIAMLIELTQAQHQQRLFDDIVFLAKFLWNSSNVMRRIGPTDEGYTKLSAEFRDAVEKFSTLIKTLIKEGQGDIKKQFMKKFFTMSQESMNHLIQLASDMSWLKNYSIDTKKQLFQ